jgi:multiple sugar transport system permease protein
MAATELAREPLRQSVRAKKRVWSGKRRRIAVRLVLYVAIIGGVVLFAFPFFWMVGSSLKSAQEIFQIPPRIIPSAFSWSNYRIALERFDFFGGLANTMIIVAGVEIGRLLSVPIAAYAFARIDFPFRRSLFILLLATMMLPYYVTLVPQFILFKDLHWLNSFLPLIVPSFFGGGGAFFIFLLRQFYQSLPREYDDAAMIDGCGHFKVFWRIILPQSKPALVVLAIFTFTTEWNDFFGPLIYLTDPSKQTLAVKFETWVSALTAPGVTREPFSHVLAIAVLITVVPVGLFFLFQRYFLRGLVVTGIIG